MGHVTRIDTEISSEVTVIERDATTKVVVAQGGIPGRDGRDGIDGVDGIDGEKGDKGDKGDTGPSVAKTQLSHEHTQVNASQVWTITHNFGYKPGGFVVHDANEVEIVPIVQQMSDNVALLLFHEPTAGTATIS